MVYLIDTAKPILPQLKRETAKETERSQPDCIIIGVSKIETARKLDFKGIKLVWVLNPESDTYSEEEFTKLREELQDNNITLLRGKHLLKEVSHSLSERYRTIFPVEVMSSTLFELPPGVRKCVEIGARGVDMRAVDPGSLVISIAGENEEPDTAVLLKPKQSRNIIDSRIVRIICQPYRAVI